MSVLSPSNWVFPKSLCTASVCLVVALSCVKIRFLSDYAVPSKQISAQFAPMRKMPWSRQHARMAQWHTVARGGAHKSGVQSLTERPKRMDAIIALRPNKPRTPVPSSENGHAEQSRFGMYAQCLMATQLSDKVSAHCTSQLTD